MPYSHTSVGTEANPSSPHSRKRSSSFLKSLKSKLTTHAEVEEEEEEEEAEEKKATPEANSMSRGSSSLQRSHSLRVRSPDKRQPAAASSTTLDGYDLARSKSLPNEQKSVSAGTNTQN